MTIPNSQRYPKKLILIKYELEINIYNFKNKQLRISTAGKHIGSRTAEIPICVSSLEPSLSEPFIFSFSILNTILLNKETLKLRTKN